MQVTFQLWKIFFILKSQWGSLPVRAIVTTSRRTSKHGSFLIWRRPAIKLSTHLQILVIRYSHWYSFLLEILFVIIQENVFNHANKLFWRWLWHHVWVTPRLPPASFIVLTSGVPRQYRSVKNRLELVVKEGLRVGGGHGDCCRLWGTQRRGVKTQKDNFIACFRGHPQSTAQAAWGHAKWRLSTWWQLMRHPHNFVFLDNLRFSELKRSVVSSDTVQPTNVLTQLLTLNLYTSFPELGSSWNPELSVRFTKNMVWRRPGQAHTC